jgi:hypothetical protein
MSALIPQPSTPSYLAAPARNLSPPLNPTIRPKVEAFHATIETLGASLSYWKLF